MSLFEKSDLMPPTVDPDVAVAAAKEWLAVRAADRRKVRSAMMRMMRSGAAPIEAMPALCRLVNMLDLIDPESAK